MFTGFQQILYISTLSCPKNKSIKDKLKLKDRDFIKELNKVDDIVKLKQMINDGNYGFTSDKNIEYSDIIKFGDEFYINKTFIPGCSTRIPDRCW